MVIRPIQAEDTESFFTMMCFLDNETPFMMYEPDEREKTTDATELRKKIDEAISMGDFLLIAEENDNVVGYIGAERGKMNRILHTAYIVVGIREAYQRQGIGTNFLGNLMNGHKRMALCDWNLRLILRRLDKYVTVNKETWRFILKFSKDERQDWTDVLN